MKFSERKGYKPVSQIIQRDDLSNELRASLWNVLDLTMWSRKGFMTHGHYPVSIDGYSMSLWHNYFKKPVDTRHKELLGMLREIRNYFFTCQWYEVYDFIEFTLNHFRDDTLAAAVNKILERELSGYRFVDGVVTDITDKHEIESLETALADDEFPAVNAHLRRALELLSNREMPDYRNSIKESISAVESLARIISGNPKAMLGDALKVMEKNSKLHPALREAFVKLYGYTSDEGGIRHAMIDEPNVTAADAKFILLSCTSFINYLKARM